MKCRQWLCAHVFGLGIMINAAGLTRADIVINVPGDADSIQQAINMAENGVTILVKPGVYNEAINFQGNAITLASTGGPEVTVLDGSGLETSVVTFANGEGPETRIIGFTITGGTGTPVDNGATTRGGGIFVFSSSPTILDCIIQSNHAAEGGGMFVEEGEPLLFGCAFQMNTALEGWGGALLAWESNVIIFDCSFVKNEASIGGGITSVLGEMLLAGCNFHGNTATGPYYTNSYSEPGALSAMGTDDGMALAGGSLGGAVASGTASLSVYDCGFTENHASTGGAIYVYSSTSHSANIEHCTFEENVATVYSAAIHVSNIEPLIQHCGFYENKSQIFGGAIGYSHYSPAPSNTGGILRNSIFTSNAASAGGALYIGAATSPQIVNCLMTDNEADSGGAVYATGISPQGPSIVNCTISANIATSGGILHNTHSMPLVVTNCIIWGNSGASLVDPAESVEVAYTIIEGGHTGEGNIDADPLFVDPDANDFRLTSRSPAIDVGNSKAVPLGIETDLDGNPRIVDGTGDGSAVVDLGAYEYQLEAILGDLNDDGAVNLFDLIILINEWGPCPDTGNCPADLNGDGVVDVFDLIILINNWTG